MVIYRPQVFFLLFSEECNSWHFFSCRPGVQTQHPWTTPSVLGSHEILLIYSILQEVERLNVPSVCDYPSSLLGSVQTQTLHTGLPDHGRDQNEVIDVVSRRVRVSVREPGLRWQSRYFIVRRGKFLSQWLCSRQTEMRRKVNHVTIWWFILQTKTRSSDLLSKSLVDLPLHVCSPFVGVTYFLVLRLTVEISRPESGHNSITSKTLLCTHILPFSTTLYKFVLFSYQTYYLFVLTLSVADLLVLPGEVTPRRPLPLPKLKWCVGPNP